MLTTPLDLFQADLQTAKHYWVSTELRPPVEGYHLQAVGDVPLAAFGLGRGAAEILGRAQPLMTAQLKSSSSL